MRAETGAQAEENTQPPSAAGPGERIEVVRWPLADLDGALAATRDAKAIIGLLMLRERRR